MESKKKQRTLSKSKKVKLKKGAKEDKNLIT